MTANHGLRADSRPAVYNERNPGVTPSDEGYLADLQAAQESRDVRSQQLEGEQASDTHQTAINQQHQLDEDTPIRIGRVLLSLPYIHCYKVQMNGRQGTCIAAATSNHSHLPLGVRSGEVIPPGSMVLVWKPKSSTLAYILSVVPLPTMHDDFNASDYVQQGGNSGPKKVEAYRNIPKSSPNAMGWVPQSSGRPIDGTIGEYVRMSETGIGLLIDSFQAFLRVNETCGLWLNYFDSYARLAGLSLQVMSYCEQVFQQYDEGELFSLRGYATYPWEATGMYGPEEQFAQEHSAEAVQLDRESPFAHKDVEDPAQTPVYRLTEHTGYLGQGFNRTLMTPGRQSGKRRLSDSDNDIGLFQELLALDGGYSLRSAKQVTIAKYPAIPNPRRRRAVEDAQGDDLEQDNEYRFSGRFGSGDPHLVRDWDDSATTEHAALLRPAGVLDLIAHHYNWKSTHPFAYHQKDYRYPEEAESDRLGPVEFLRGRMHASYVSPSGPQQLQIDSRYGDANYYNTAAFFSITEDGSIVLGDGYGSQLLMSGGQIRLEAGGDVMLMSGSRVVSLSQETILRSQGSVDISSSEADVRVKAENNMQLLAGNSGSGGLLLESRGQGLTQDYQQKVGEEVSGSGIVMLSRGGSVSTMTKNIYMRTGVDDGSADGQGDIVFDCANGRSNMLFYARSHQFFNSDGLGIWHGPTGQEDVDIEKAHFFGPNFAKINGPTVMAKSVVICENGSLGVDNGIYARGSIIALKQMAARRGIVGDSETNNIPEDVNKFISDFCETAEGLTEFATPFFKGYYSSLYWAEKFPGNNTLLENEIGFSFRDNPGSGPVYGYAAGQFFLLETRWQQLQRTGLVSDDDNTWKENSVQYQGNELYPWPGKKNWVDEEAFLSYGNGEGFLLYDPAGYAKSREEHRNDYEQPQFRAWTKESCDEHFKF